MLIVSRYYATWLYALQASTGQTVYPMNYAHGFVVIYFLIYYEFLMDLCDLFTHIFQDD